MPINPVAPVVGPSQPASTQQTSSQASGFDSLLKDGIESVNRNLQQASQTSEDYLNGKKYSMHEVIIALEKADLSFRFMTQVRNKVLGAYQEIMRIQV